MQRLLYILLLAITLMSCGGVNDKGLENVPRRSVYYWRTVFRLDSTERQFLDNHNIERMYVRYFDVVENPDNGIPMPNATIKCAEPMPAGINIVPTIFIMENCIPFMDECKQQLVDRILQMNETHDIVGVNEVQIDCDWTARSQGQYYQLLAWLRQAFKAHGIELSATIRLHQLSMTPPPVDRGTLMMYNTGDLTATNGHNPILDYRDAYPYLKHLGDYKLPLTVAWPCYSWNLLYNDNRFKAILYNANLADTCQYRMVAPGHYVVKNNVIIAEPNSNGSDITWQMVGDSVITMRPTAQQIIDIVAATEQERPGLNHRVILYSLDSKNINTYNNEYFKTLFNR